jgi:SpoVK/Ycf46/Vps4 family AAA+-type ATPase
MAGILSRDNHSHNDAFNRLEQDKIRRADMILQASATQDAEQRKMLLADIQSKSKQRIDLSLLLQLLDGVVENSDRLIIATTNCIDIIDPALLRPARFDLVIKLQYFNSEEISEILCKLIPLTEEEKQMVRGEQYAENVWSPLEIVQLVIQMNKNVENIINILKQPPQDKISALQ